MSLPQRDPADPRVDLARDRTGMASYRTQLAMDRTTLAWVRTNLGMASFGFGMVAFFRSLEERSMSPETIRLHRGAVGMGTALILLGIAATMLAGLSHWNALKRLRRGQTPVLSHWPLSLTLVVFSTILGLAGLWALFVR